MNLLKLPTFKNNKPMFQFELLHDDGTLLAVAVPTDKPNEFRILNDLSKEPRFGIILSNSIINMGNTIANNE